MLYQLNKWLSNPFVAAGLCGYFPGIIFLFTAWRISRKGEFTISSTNFDIQGWRKPKAYKGKKQIRSTVNYYYFLGVFFIVTASIILFSYILK
jgi:hypothetical protein